MPLFADHPITVAVVHERIGGMAARHRGRAGRLTGLSLRK